MWVAVKRVAVAQAPNQLGETQDEDAPLRRKSDPAPPSAMNLG